MQLANSPNPWLVHRARIASIVPEIDEVVTYQLDFCDEQLRQQYRFAAGQFNMLYMPGCGEVAISMSGSPAASYSNALMHTVRAVGRVTDALTTLTVGDEIGIRGPYGTSWPIDACLNQDVILLAGGIGLAPLRPVIYALLEQPELARRKVLLMGARSPQLMLYADEFQQWRAAGWEVITTVDQASGSWQGNVGVVPKLFDTLTTVDGQRTIVMTCGPEIMMHFAALAALARGIPAESIWVSLERHMQCAIGLCGHCQLGPAFVCKDGPVFRYDVARRLMQVKEW